MAFTCKHHGVVRVQQAGPFFSCVIPFNGSNLRHQSEDYNEMYALAKVAAKNLSIDLINEYDHTQSIHHTKRNDFKSGPANTEQFQRQSKPVPSRPIEGEDLHRHSRSSGIVQRQNPTIVRRAGATV